MCQVPIGRCCSEGCRPVSGRRCQTQLSPAGSAVGPPQDIPKPISKGGGASVKTCLRKSKMVQKRVRNEKKGVRNSLGIMREEKEVEILQAPVQRTPHAAKERPTPEQTSTLQPMEDTTPKQAVLTGTVAHKEPMLEQFLKHYSPWEGLTLEWGKSVRREQQRGAEMD